MVSTLDLFQSLATPGYQHDPYPTLRGLRSREPVHRSGSSGTWFLTGHAPCVQALRSPRFGRDLRLWDSPFNPAAVGRPPLDPAAAAIVAFLQRWMLNLNPPDHTRMRRVFQPLFLPAAITELTGAIEAIMDDVLTGLPPAGTIELVERVAEELPDRVTRHLLGSPADEAPDLRRWTAAVMTSLSPVATGDEKKRAIAALPGLEHHATKLVSAGGAVRQTPFVRQIVAAAGKDGCMTSRELVVNVVGLLLAAHETTSALIGNAIYSLLRHPVELQRLRDHPELIDAAIEECLRHEPPSTLTPRIALQDVVLEGIHIPAGSLCWCVHAGAARDPVVFSAPDSLDIGRPPNPHLVFGGGVHHCIGASLARLQTRTALRRLLHRYQHMELIPGSATWRASVSVRSLVALDVHAQ